MIPMLWSLLVFGALASLAAWTAERARWLAGSSRRIPWLLAIVATAAWPFVWSSVGSALASSPIVAVTRLQPLVVIAQTATVAAVARPAFATGIVALWALASFFLLLRLAQAARMAGAALRAGEPAVVDAQSVVLSDGFGPAVVGWIRPRVLWPRWLSGVDASLRQLILRHEREHCRARDPLSLLVAECAVVLMPWHPAVWWMRFRLRAAVELDCDARVLAGDQDAPRYGRLLILLAQRQPTLRLASMLAEPRSLLSRRILTMTTPRPHHARLRATFFALASLAAIVTACTSALNREGGTAPATRVAKVADTAPPSLAAGQPSTTGAYFEYQVDEPVRLAPGSQVRPLYPTAEKAAGVEGEVLAQFIVGTDGLMEPGTFRVLRPATPATAQLKSAAKVVPDNELNAFELSVREGVTHMLFTPAKVNGVVVRGVVQMPFVFAIAK